MRRTDAAGAPAAMPPRRSRAAALFLAVLASAAPRAAGTRLYVAGLSWFGAVGDAAPQGGELRRTLAHPRPRSASPPPKRSRGLSSGGRREALSPPFAFKWGAHRSVRSLVMAQALAAHLPIEVLNIALDFTEDIKAAAAVDMLLGTAWEGYLGHLVMSFPLDDWSRGRFSRSPMADEQAEWAEIAGDETDDTSVPGDTDEEEEGGNARRAPRRYMELRFLPPDDRGGALLCGVRTRDQNDAQVWTTIVWSALEPRYSDEGKFFSLAAARDTPLGTAMAPRIEELMVNSGALMLSKVSYFHGQGMGESPVWLAKKRQQEG